MNKRLLLFATVLTLPVAGVVLWMVVPASKPTASCDTALEEPAAALGANAPSRASVTVMVADRPLADTSKIVRRSDDDFPELPQDAPPTAPAPPVTISPRFRVPADFKAASLVQGLKNTPAELNERIRVLPAEVLEAERVEPRATGEPVSVAKSALADGAVVLQVDRSLHDPAAWVDERTPTAAHAAVKAKIADEFAAEVGRAATKPETSGKTLDETWKDARSKANWEYQMFFGGEAANRAGLNAGRAALSKQ